MTVSVASNKVTYAGDGATLVFAFPFAITDEAHLRVVLRSSAGTETVQAITTNYSVSAGPWTTGGNVTMFVAPASGETLLIKTAEPYTQEVDLIDGDALPAASLEGALDKLTRLVQQVREESGRAVTLQEITALAGLVIPDPTAGTILYSADGTTLTWAAIGTVSGTPLATPIPIAQGGTAAATAADARVNLGENASGSFFTRKHNFAGSAAPSLTDDTNAGYSVGSWWYDATNDTAYTCLDATASAAVWLALVADPGPSFKNRIINGDVRIDQRNVGAAVTVNSGSTFFGPDCWRAVGEAADGVFTVARSTSTPPAGFSHFLRATVTTADASIGSGQRYRVMTPFEGLDMADLGFGAAGAQSVTLSFRVRSSLTGTFSGALRNGAANRSYPFEFVINAANTWETKTVTIAGDTTGTWPTDNTQWGVLQFDLGAGSTYRGTAGAWAAADYAGATGAVSLIGTLSATFDISGVQLEVGSAATEFERVPFAVRVARCQRYFWKSFDLETALGSTSSNGYVLSALNSAGTGGVGYALPVPMRAAPTVTLYNQSTGGTGTWRDSGASNRSPSNVYGGERAISVSFSSAAADGAIGGHLIASAEL